jgi:hypothetical protein
MNMIMTEISDAALIDDSTVVGEIDQATLDVKLATLKTVEIPASAINLYVLKINKLNKNKRCQEVRNLQCAPALAMRLAEDLKKNIMGRGHISNFSDITTNQDNRIYYVNAHETDFPQILSVMYPPADKGEIKTISSLKELTEFNGYVVEVCREEGLSPLYGFRYIAQAWSPKNSAGGFFKFNNDMVAIIDDSPVFRIDSYFDFVVLGDDMHVLDCGKFETAMQFKERLEEIKLETVSEMQSSNAFVDDGGSVLATAIGTDKHFLRQLSSVKNKGFFKDPVWMGQLREAARNAGNWLIEFDPEGKIVVKPEKEYIRELLTLLQNKRVRTVVDQNIFDVDGELVAQIVKAE